MDAVDRCMPIAENLHEGLLKVRPQWNELMHGRIDITEFKALCHNIDDLLGQVEGDSSELRGQLTEILMAQDFQDLTGQIISRVITLVNELENRLVNILAAHKTRRWIRIQITTKSIYGPRRSDSQPSRARGCRFIAR